MAAYFVPAKNKQEAVTRISDLTGSGPEVVGRGSTEYKSVFLNLSRELMLGLGENLTKTELAEGIVRRLGGAWSDECCSTGETITLVGLNAVLEAAESFLSAPSPLASDLDVGSQGSASARTEQYVNRIVRDSALARRVKLAHSWRCQVCEETLLLPDGSAYAEAHHLWPLGTPHDGPDLAENMVCVCPNHHALLDLGAITIELSGLAETPAHKVGSEYIAYHNNTICSRWDEQGD